MMEILLISGSREWDNSLISKVKARVQAAVQYAKANDYQLFVGDAPGVDELAIWYAAKSDLPCVIHGKGGKIRATNVGKLAKCVADFRNYTDRDEYMVSNAYVVYCLWNGYSKGTRHVCAYAKAIGKCTWFETIRQEAA